MNQTQSPTARTGADIARALIALLTLAAFVAGVPAALIALAPTYLPDLTSVGQLWGQLTAPDNGTLLLGTLGAVAWLAWAAFSTSVILELVAGARRMRAPTIPLLGGVQRTASNLIATAGILLAVSGHLAATATPAHADPITTSQDLAHETPALAAGVSRTPPPVRDTPSPVENLPSVTVQRGDTLWDLAERHLGSGTRYTQIRDLNLHRTQSDGRTLADADWILPGWTLLLPADATEVTPAAEATVVAPANAATVTVQPGDTLWSIAERHLGDGHLYPKLVDLNADRPQPDGGRLTDPNRIRPGWTFLLPTGATPIARPTPAPPAPPAVPPATDADTPTTTAVPDAVEPPIGPWPAATQPPQALSVPRTSPAATESARVAPWFLGLAALGAVGFVGEIGRRRHLQQRARAIGETIPLPTSGSPPAVAERELRTAATPVTIPALITTLTNVASRCFDSGLDLPRVGALLLDEHHLTLLLTDDASDAVPPFNSTALRRWVATTLDVAAEEPIDDPDQPMPYPLLVTLGHTSDATLIVNLEAAGTLSITGDDTVAEDVLRALVIEAATSDLAGRLPVKIDDKLADLAAGFEDFRLRPADDRDDRGALEKEVAGYMAAHGHADTLQARAKREPPDIWLPVTHVEHTLRSAPSAPWTGVVTLTRDPAAIGWTLQTRFDGSARLEPLAVDVQPQRLTAEHLGELRSVLLTSLPPEPQSETRAPLATIAEDIAAVTSSTPRPPEPGDAEAEVSIDLLGPIRFQGLPATADHLTAQMKELLVYLALHGPATGADLEEVLWGGERVRSGTRATLAYRVRDRVGKDVLPKATDNGHFRLGPTVTTDWARFQNLVADALTRNGSDRINALADALALVRDRPLRGISGGQYSWADYDIQQMTSAIADAAHLLARLLHQTGRDRDALAAALHGLSVEPFSDALQQLAIAATGRIAGPDAAHKLRKRFTAGMAGLDPGSSS